MVMYSELIIVIAVDAFFLYDFANTETKKEEGMVMKRILMLVGVLCLLSFCITGCDSGNKEADTKAAVEKVKDVASDTAEAVKETAEDVVEATKESATAAVEKGKEVVSDTAEVVKETAEDVVEATKEKSTQ